MGAFTSAFIVGFPIIAAETMTCVVIDVARDIRMGFLDFRNLVEGDTAVLVTEIKDHRTFRRSVFRCMDAAAIKGRCSRQPGALGRAHPGHGAAKAIADDADLAGF